MSRFTSLVSSLRRETPSNGEDAAAVIPPSEAVQRAVALAAWASHSICKDVFLPYLDRLIERADVAEGESLASHVAMAFARGQRDALKTLRAEFNDWQTRA